MILTGEEIRKAGIITPHQPRTVQNGMSYGESYCGYDVRVDLPELFRQKGWMLLAQRFTLAATLEQFKMPDDVVGFVKDKSTWARRGVSVFNTVIEPGWRGFLTLEIVCHSTPEESVWLRQGDPIAQIVFQRTSKKVKGYRGKYQDQERGAQGARLEL